MGGDAVLCTEYAQVILLPPALNFFFSKKKMGVCFSTISSKKNRIENRIKVTTLENTFYLWRIAVVVSLRKRESERHSTRLAELHQRIADNEETVANAVRILYCPRNETTSSSDHTCVVCLNETTRQFVQCGSGHCICESCIDAICETAVQKREIRQLPSRQNAAVQSEFNLSKTVWGGNSFTMSSPKQYCNCFEFAGNKYFR